MNEICHAFLGMLLLAAWSTNGWLPSGHAMRMALDLGLHRALEKLADDTGKQRTEDEERNLVVSARIWLCLYWFDHQYVNIWLHFSLYSLANIPSHSAKDESWHWTTHCVEG